jgi:hypothetical protein
MAARDWLAEEACEFERNSHVTTDGKVVTGYGGLASFVDSDGTVYESDAGPTPERLERDRVRAHELRTRVRYQRLMQAERRLVTGCLGQRLRRMPQARRPRPAARRRTVSTRAGPSALAGGDEPPGEAEHLDLDAWLAERIATLDALTGRPA